MATASNGYSQFRGIHVWNSTFEGGRILCGPDTLEYFLQEFQEVHDGFGTG